MAGESRGEFVKEEFLCMPNLEIQVATGESETANVAAVEALEDLAEHIRRQVFE